MSRMTYKLSHPLARKNACQAVMGAPDGYVVIIQEATRSVEQNSAQWPILEALSQQLQWPVNGELVYMPPEDWKDLLTACWRKERARIAQGVDGGFVMLGVRTSQLGKKAFSEWLEYLHWFCAEKGVSIERPAAEYDYPEAS